jgi:hypothetical protein
MRRVETRRSAQWRICTRNDGLRRGGEQDREIRHARQRRRVPKEIAVAALLETIVGAAVIFRAMVVLGAARHRMMHDTIVRTVRRAPRRTKLRNGRHDRNEQHRHEGEKGDRTMSGESGVHGSMRSVNDYCRHLATRWAEANRRTSADSCYAHDNVTGMRSSTQTITLTS